MHISLLLAFYKFCTRSLMIIFNIEFSQILCSFYFSFPPPILGYKSGNILGIQLYEWFLNPIQVWHIKME